MLIYDIMEKQSDYSTLLTSENDIVSQLGEPERFKVNVDSLVEWDGTHFSHVMRKKTVEEKNHEKTGNFFKQITEPLINFVYIPPMQAAGWIGEQFGLDFKGEKNIAQAAGVLTLGALAGSYFFKPVRYAILGLWGLTGTLAACLTIKNSIENPPKIDNYKIDSNAPHLYQGLPKLDAAEQVAAFRAAATPEERSETFHQARLQEERNAHIRSEYQRS